MAFILNMYSDAQCKTPVLSPAIGVAGITGYYATKTNWVSRTEWGYTFYRLQTSSTEGRAGIILSGATPIFDFQRISDREIFTAPDNNAITTDTARNGVTTKVYNIVFAGVRTQSGNRLTSNTLNFTGSQSPNWFNFGIRVQQYIQEPLDATGADRTLWTYNDSVSYFEASAQFTGALQQCVCVYKFPMWDDEFYLFALGVSAAGEPNSSTVLFAIPVDFFNDKEIKPYVGPVSKDSAATSFTPTSPYHDSISGRDLTGKRNPIGFNSGNGLRLLQLDNAGYSLILYGIYSGSSSSLLNYAGQLIDQVTGGEGHRPAEEVQPMTQGVLCCHIVPAIATYGSGIYNLKSIAGYRLSLVGVPGLLCSQHIYSYTSPAVSVAPRLNSFLDYEPYTSIIFHLPFFGDISVSPSALLGNSIQAEYELDIYTGILSCNIFIITPESRYIISTQQSKISTELPIIGAAANQNAIGTIAQATGGLARARMQQARAQEIGTQAEQAAAAANTAASAAAGAITTVDALSRAGNAVPVGGSSVEGIGNYLVSRAAYLIITRPQPSLPENFAQLYGAVSNISGTVSSFAGYTEFSAVDLRGIDATDAEKAQILALLRGGVFI